MKKFLMMVALMLGISTATFAGGDNVNTAIAAIDNIPTHNYFQSNNKELNYDFRVDYIRLAEYLKLKNTNDIFFLRETHESFCAGMLLAEQEETEDARNNIIYNSIDNELKMMKAFLSERQYRMFLRVLNVTFHNRGFSHFILNYSERNKG